jgi:hypothetical protein
LPKPPAAPYTGVDRGGREGRDGGSVSGGARRTGLAGGSATARLRHLFEIMILRLRERPGVTPKAMRANHTNLE